jgi:hypothetical protein
VLLFFHFQALMFVGALGDTLAKIKTSSGKLMQLVFVIPVRVPDMSRLLF